MSLHHKILKYFGNCILLNCFYCNPNAICKTSSEKRPTRPYQMPKVPVGQKSLRQHLWGAAPYSLFQEGTVLPPAWLQSWGMKPSCGEEERSAQPCPGHWRD